MTSDHFICPLATNNDTYIILLELFWAGYNSCLPHDSEYCWGTFGESEYIRCLDVGWVNSQYSIVSFICKLKSFVTQTKKL